MPGGGGCRNRHGGQPQRDHAAGLTLHVRARRAGARVVIYAAGPHAAVAAHFAGAYALVDPRVLVEVVVAAGGGERRLPLLSAAMRRRAAAALEPADRAILAMRLAGTSRAETAETAQMTVSSSTAAARRSWPRSPVAPAWRGHRSLMWPKLFLTTT